MLHCRQLRLAIGIVVVVLSACSHVHTQQLIPIESQHYYELLNTVTMTELGQQRSHQPASYTFKTELLFQSVWHSANAQLLEVFIREPSVSTTTKGNKRLLQEITKMPDRPFYISLIDNKPVKVIAHSSRDQSLLNLKRGIASLLQLQYTDGPVSELDVSGQCNAFYRVHASTKIEKIKTDCSHWDLRVNYRAEKPLGIEQHSSERLQFELSADGTLQKVESLEEHRVALAAKPDVGNVLKSQFVLRHLEIGQERVKQLQYDSLDAAIGSLLEWYRVFDIEADVDGVISELKGKTLSGEIAKHKAQLTDEHIGKPALALITAELLPLARITKQPEFVQILRAHKKLLPQLVDLLGAVQTIDAHMAIHEVFEYANKADFPLLEKYLQGLAVGTHPERAIIEHLLGLLVDKQAPIKIAKLKDTVTQTLAALTRQSSFEVNDPLLQQVRTFITEHLRDCDANIECKTLYLRALQNLRDVPTLPVLMELTLHEHADVSVAAMQALQAFPLAHFTEAHRQQFAEIFYQTKRKYDSSARALALDLLLALKPTKEQLGHMLDYLISPDRQFEIKTYVVQKLRMLAAKCPRFAALLRACLAERSAVNNYDVLAQKGLTTVLFRELSTAPAFNESLLSVQEINQGVLKRGSVELLLGAGRDDISTFKLGLYTTGLGSFVGDGDEENDEDEPADTHPASAGMEIAVQGVVMRPLVFFVGQTELMGHIWKGTATDFTPAYQATTLAQDHEHYLVIASGATAYIRVIGTKSIDLSGKATASIWNRNAETQIQQNTAAAVVGYMAAGFTYAKLESHFTLVNEPKINLNAKLDFYSGVKLCMQLERPDLLQTQSHTKTVFLNAAKPYTLRVRTEVAHKSPGRTLSLNQKNNEMCNILDDN